jgi:hypothetical protein
MHGLARYAPLMALVPLLAACHIVPDFSSATSSAPATPSGTQPSVIDTSPSAPATGPLGVLLVPAGAKPWSDNKSTPLDLNAFVEGFYVKSAWTTEKGLYRQRGFVSGTLQGWINADGSQESIAIAKFAASSGAISLFDGLTGTLKDSPAPAKAITDSTDGAVGVSDPTLDSDGDALAEIATHTGAYVIDVHVWTASTPSPAIAKALLSKQYQVIKGNS